MNQYQLVKYIICENTNLDIYQLVYKIYQLLLNKQFFDTIFDMGGYAQLSSNMKQEFIKIHIQKIGHNHVCHKCLYVHKITYVINSVRTSSTYMNVQSILCLKCFKVDYGQEYAQDDIYVKNMYYL
jgi:hypothetical protein